MEIDKTLVVLVDGTLKMAPYWDTIRNSILDNIIRRFCNNSTSPFKRSSDQKIHLKLIVFYSDNDYNGLALDSYISNNLDTFMSRLSRLTFIDRGIKLPALEEGISAALQTFPVIGRRSEDELAGTRHCVLVTANQPSVWTQYCVVPTNFTFDIGGATVRFSERIMADAECLAALFAKTFISFSVICPKEFTTLRKLYNAENAFYRIPGYFLVEFKHPEFLILISEKFPEAREALQNFYFLEIPEMLSEHDSLYSESRTVSVRQRQTMIQEAVSEPSVQQLAPENLGEVGVDERALDDDWNLEMQENHVPVTVTEELDLCPYEEVGSNFENGSTAPSRQIVTSNIGPSGGEGRFDRIENKKCNVISAIPAESACSSTRRK